MILFRPPLLNIVMGHFGWFKISTPDMVYGMIGCEVNMKSSATSTTTRNYLKLNSYAEENV